MSLEESIFPKRMANDSPSTPRSETSRSDLSMKAITPDPFATPAAESGRSGLRTGSAQSSSCRFPFDFENSYSQSRRRHGVFFRSRAMSKEDLKQRTPFHLTPLGKRSLRNSRIVFLFFVFFGVAGSVGLLLSAYFSSPRHTYCLVLDEQFQGNTIDKNVWSYEHQVGGFGNGEFEWTTDSTNNSFVADGRLYIVPTLTSDQIGIDAVTNGYTLNLTDTGVCTGTTPQDCGITSNNTFGNISVIPPIQSARLTTRYSNSIRFGRVEVKARMSTGDWIWPAIWMMPRDSFYGPWPASGEIDIVESKGNAVVNRKDDNADTVRSSLHWGPDPSLDRWYTTTALHRRIRTYYNQRDVVFGLDWHDQGIYTWVRTPANRVLVHSFKDSFFDDGKFPSTTSNGTGIANPWATSDTPKMAPFDQNFYLILSVAVGGTNGYFPDSTDKPWSNAAQDPALDFWNSRSRWLPSWPTDVKERGMSVDYVKMYSIAPKGQGCPAT